MCYVHNQWYDISYAILYISSITRPTENHGLTFWKIGHTNIAVS